MKFPLVAYADPPICGKNPCRPAPPGVSAKHNRWQCPYCSVSSKIPLYYICLRVLCTAWGKTATSSGRAPRITPPMWSDRVKYDGHELQEVWRGGWRAGQPSRTILPPVSCGLERSLSKARPRPSILIGINLMLRMGSAGVRPWSHARQTQGAHQSLHPFAIDPKPQILEIYGHPATPKKRRCLILRIQ